MRTNILVLIFTVLLIYVSCNSKQEEVQSDGQRGVEVALKMEETPDLEEVAKFSPSPIAANEVVLEEDNSKIETLGNKVEEGNKKIIKDGTITIRTDDILATKKGIDDQLKKMNAYYESEDLQNNDETISYALKIRVPANNFELLISNIENGKDEIKSKNIQARDVSEEYVDIEARLTNKREYLKRYREILSKALTVKDILAIEENIRTLQEEIESKEGRLKYLSDQVAFCTLNLNLYKNVEFIYKPQQQDKFSERVKTSLSSGWTSVINFILWIITLWPYIILIITIYIVIKRLFKKRKNEKLL